MATILDVAFRANVSIATVSRVLNNKPHKVNKATQEKVLTAARELDYRPNALAKSLLTKKTMTIGIIIPDISNPYYAEIVRGIQDVAEPAGYTAMLHNTDRKQERILRDIYLLREKAADGVIFSGGVIGGYETLSALKELRDRVVVIGRHEVDFPAVLVDNISGASQAVQHLVDLGHRRIGFIGGSDESTTGRDRLTGYLNALAKNGITPDRRLVKNGDWRPRSGYLLARELLKGREVPTAIVAANDQMAFGALSAVKEKGLAVPASMAVVGFDNIPLSSYFDPPLTTVRIPMYDLGAGAMRLLMDLISGKKASKFKHFKPKLLVRGSTAPKPEPGLRMY